MGIVSNAQVLAKKYAKKAALLRAKLRKKLLAIGSQIENEQVDLLTGGKKAGDYPIPVRTGSLRRHVLAPKVLVGTSLVLPVGNTSRYAITIHEGLKSSKKHGPRPFVFDAIEKTDIAGQISREYFKALAL